MSFPFSFSDVATVGRAAPSGGSPSYLFSDDLLYADNAAALTAQWGITGTPAFGTTTGPGSLSGRKCLKISGFGGDSTTTPPFAGAADTWIYFQFAISSLSTTQKICGLLDDSDTETANVSVLNTGVVRIKAGSTGSTVPSGAGAIIAGSVYNIWVRYKPSTGSGATMEVYASSSETRGPVAVSTTSGFGYEQACKLALGPVASGPALYWSKIRVADAELTGIPT